mmetsp:Transcript_3871/g.16451  ORF Transcript_3871/g.16451 Transcript_3871/m.16451 type:complete len:502 (-) Transcript_3871:475-1980(-)
MYALALISSMVVESTPPRARYFSSSRSAARLGAVRSCTSARASATAAMRSSSNSSPNACGSSATSRSAVLGRWSARSAECMNRRFSPATRARSISKYVSLVRRSAVSRARRASLTRSSASLRSKRRRSNSASASSRARMSRAELSSATRRSSRSRSNAALTSLSSTVNVDVRTENLVSFLARSRSYTASRSSFAPRSVLSSYACDSLIFSKLASYSTFACSSAKRRSSACFFWSSMRSSCNFSISQRVGRSSSRNVSTSRAAASCARRSSSWCRRACTSMACLLCTDATSSARTFSSLAFISAMLASRSCFANAICTASLMRRSTLTRSESSSSRGRSSAMRSPRSLTVRSSLCRATVSASSRLTNARSASRIFSCADRSTSASRYFIPSRMSLASFSAWRATSFARSKRAIRSCLSSISFWIFNSARSRASRSCSALCSATTRPSRSTATERWSRIMLSSIVASAMLFCVALNIKSSTVRSFSCRLLRSASCCCAAVSFL